VSDELVSRYYEKQYAGESGMRIPLLDPDFYADKLQGKPYRHRRRKGQQEKSRERER
jgi:hypothetical protein